MTILFQLTLTLYLASLLISTAGQSISLLLFFVLALIKLIQARTFQGLQTCGLPLLSFVLWGLLTTWFLAPGGTLAVEILLDMKWALSYWVMLYLLLQFPTPAPQRIFKFMSVLVIAVGFYGLAQMFFRFDLIRSTVEHMSPYGDFYRAVGFYKVPLTYAYTIGMIGIFAGAAVMLKSHIVPRWLTWMAFLASILGLIASNTRGAWIGFLAAYFAGAALQDRRILVRVLVMTGIALSALSLHPDFRSRVTGSFDFTHMGSNKERLGLWQANFEMFKDHPLTGVGWKQSRQFLPEYYERLGLESTFINHPHNDYVAVLSELGILGMILFLWLVFTFLKLSYQLFKHSENPNIRLLGLGALMAQILFFVGSLTQCNFQDMEVRSVLLIIWAALAASKHFDSRNPSLASER